ncbi:MAG: LysR family transcriptional regulator [Rhodospirillales bacterium]|nr:LysR family transcriptional regulator [Rhodospirillales bacterium]
MDRFVTLRTFVSVVNGGSFANAARKLGLSRAMATKHIQTLEEHLGVRLLNRTTRRLALTEAGRAFHARAERILADLEEAENAVGDANTMPKGLLRVAAPMSFGVAHLSPAIADFMCEFPEMAVELSLNDRVVDLIDEGLDMAVRIGRLADSSLIAKRLATARFAVAAAPTYLAERGTPKEPEDLVRHDCLEYTLSSRGSDWVFAGPGGSVRAVRASGPLKANNGEALLAAAIAGRGIVYLPTFMVGATIAAGKLVPLFSGDWQPEELAISAVYPPTRHLSAKVRRFVDFLTRRFADPPWDRWERTGKAKAARPR